MNRMLSLFSFAIAASFVCTDVASETAPAPVYAAGQSWAFDHLVNDVAYYHQEAIVRIDPDAIEVRVSSPEGEVSRKFSRSMNPLDEAGKEILQVKHPLAVGHTWEYEFTIRTPVGDYRVRNTREAKVTAIERIRVAAGEFDCYRIEATGFYTNLSGTSPFGNSGYVTEKSWYAQAVGRVIRNEVISTARSTGATITARDVKTQLRRYEPGR